MPKKPSFLIVGAIKSGTTSLYRYLSQHPGIYMPPVKELNFFLKRPGKRSLFQGPDVTYKAACRSREEYLRMFEPAPDGSVIGEVTHAYLYAPESPELVREFLGSPKIVAVLRNPVDRAYAQYAFLRKLHTEPLESFEAGLEMEDARIRAGWDPVFHYVNRGLYGSQLERYYRKFPEQNIRIYQFESFFKDTCQSLADLFQFVGADPGFTPDTSKKHIPGGDPRSPGVVSEVNTGVPEPKPVSSELRTRLIGIFKDDIYKTMDLTGLDLKQWLT